MGRGGDERGGPGRDRVQRRGTRGEGRPVRRHDRRRGVRRGCGRLEPDERDARALPDDLTEGTSSAALHEELRVHDAKPHRSMVSLRAGARQRALGDEIAALLFRERETLANERALNAAVPWPTHRSRHRLPTRLRNGAPSPAPTGRTRICPRRHPRARRASAARDGVAGLGTFQALRQARVDVHGTTRTRRKGCFHWRSSEIVSLLTSSFHASSVDSLNTRPRLSERPAQIAEISRRASANDQPRR